MKIMLLQTFGMINDSGGVAKVASLMANEMYSRGHEISLVYSDEETGNFFYKIAPAVETFNLKTNLDGSNIKFPLYLKVLRELVRPISKRKSQSINRYFNEKQLTGNLAYCLQLLAPDIIISFQIESSILLLHYLKTKIPVVTMSHGPQREKYDANEIEALEKSAVYQVLCPSFERYINKILPKVQTTTIGNAIPQYAFSADLAAVKHVYKIVNIGRLVKNHKRQHLLVQAFAELAGKYPDWIVEIWGEWHSKVYYAEMQRYIKSHNLQNRILFKGTTANVSDVLKKADIFAFPSAHEGFGMALAEGMSAGLPAVGYKDCTGVNELIIDNKTGFLCDAGVLPFQQALEKLMSDQQLRVKMGKAAKAEMAKFAPAKIFDEWEKLMNKVVQKSQGQK